mmetsp:Transcript_3347/g.11042  ORF Transcript_3347/g.11042 Transcript_3347/m.11042 type:complete len:326 (+) Transcript_3347:982-1959(+)
MVFGPPQLAKVRRTSSLTAPAARRDPVKYAAKSSSPCDSSANTCRCTDRSHDKKFTSNLFWSLSSLASGSSSSKDARSFAHLKQCWLVLPRERMTTGTPHSMFRRTFLDKSRKFEKFDTQSTSAADRSTRRTPRRSASKSSSFIARSIGPTWRASSISVTPSCLWKSIAWFAMSTGANSSPNKRASARRTASFVRSTSRTVVRFADSRISFASSMSDSSAYPFSLPKASTVATRVPPGFARPPIKLQTGSANHSSLCARISSTARRRSPSVSTLTFGAAIAIANDELATWYARLLFLSTTTRPRAFFIAFVVEALQVSQRTVRPF